MQHFTPTQLISTGAVVYDEERRKKYERYLHLLEKAGFLNEKEKRNWRLLGGLLTTQQLEQGIQIIISEEMRLYKMRSQLEKIKPIKEQYGRR